MRWLDTLALLDCDWFNQAYDSSNGADYRGSRKVTLGLLSGSVLPMWSALEKTVAVCRAQMTKAEEALKVFDRCVAVVVVIFAAIRALLLSLCFVAGIRCSAVLVAFLLMSLQWE